MTGVFRFDVDIMSERVHTDLGICDSMSVLLLVPLRLRGKHVESGSINDRHLRRACGGR